MTYQETTRDEIIRAIDNVLSACAQTQARKANDKIVQGEVKAIELLRSSVMHQWPLSVELKSRLNIGVVASRNLDDWVPRLANAIMVLDYVLKHDGDRVEKLLKPIELDDL